MQNKNTNTGSKLSMDLQDSPGDKKEMQKPEITVIDLPEATDIPWQENIALASTSEIADEMFASADEEGDDLLVNYIDEDSEENSDSNVSETEKEDLEKTANDMPAGDDINL